jgi:hypothetical protein
LGDAARAARASFSEIRDGASEAGRETGYSMAEARHGVMLLGEEFSIRLPRALTTFIASLGPIGSAMEAAFPFLAVAVGATLLLEHLAKLREEGQKLTASQINFGTVTANVLNALNDKLLEAGIKTDELRGDHLAALNKELALIDHQSLKELAESFNTVAKAADLTFAELKTSWYQFGAGSAGAKNALDEFKNKYDALIAQGKDKEASDLLAGTKQSAEHILDLMKQAKDNQTTTGTAGTHQGDYTKFEAAKNELKAQGIGFTQKEVEAQEKLVGALQEQVSVQEKVNELKAAQSSNAKASTGNQMSEEADRAARDQAQIERQAVEQSDKLWEQHYREAVSQLQESEREKIDANKQGSAARLQAIDQAIKEEQARGLQDTAFYKSLLRDRVNTAKEMQGEMDKLQAEAGKEEADHMERMAALTLAAKKEHAQALVALAKITAREELAEEEKAENEAYQKDSEALQKELQALDKHNADYQNRVKAMNDKIEELRQQHNNRMQQLDDQAQQRELASLRAWASKVQGEYASEFSKVIMGKESFAHAMQHVDEQMATSALKWAMQQLMSLETVQGRKRFGDARTAAADAFASAGNPILGAVEAGATFATVMSFSEGGEVPYIGGMLAGVGDSVPAMLEPGEGILTKQVMDGLKEQALAGGNKSSGGDVHVHHHATYHVQAFDSDGVRTVLREHGDQFAEHVGNHLRRLNK